MYLLVLRFANSCALYLLKFCYAYFESGRFYQLQGIAAALMLQVKNEQPPDSKTKVIWWENGYELETMNQDTTLMCTKFNDS